MKNSKSGCEHLQELQVIFTTVSIPGLNAATVNWILKNKVVFIDTRASLDFFAFLLLPPQADKFLKVFKNQSS